MLLELLSVRRPSTRPTNILELCADPNHTTKPESLGHVEASSTSLSVIGPGAANTHLMLTYLESFMELNICFTWPRIGTVSPKRNH